MTHVKKLRSNEVSESQIAFSQVLVPHFCFQKVFLVFWVRLSDKDLGPYSPVKLVVSFHVCVARPA